MLLIAVSCSCVATPCSIGERAARLLDDHLHGGEVVGLDADGVDGDVDRALGDEAVLPEVAEPARPARRAAAATRARSVRPSSSQPGLNVTHTWASARSAMSLTWQRRPSANDPSPRAAHHRRPSAGADTTPTTAPRSRCVERDQRRPHRDAADEAGGAVDRIDDPAPRRLGRALDAVLLAEQRRGRVGRRGCVRRAATRSRGRPRSPRCGRPSSRARSPVARSAAA